MKKVINGIEYETFPEGKIIKELGIDVKRKFIVCDKASFLISTSLSLSIGDILVLKTDDNSSYPFFHKIGFEHKIIIIPLSCLAYYDEPFKVGDRVRLIDNKNMSASLGAIGKVSEPDEWCKKHNGIIVRWIKGSNDQMDGGYLASNFEKVGSCKEKEVEINLSCPIVDSAGNVYFRNLYMGSRGEIKKLIKPTGKNFMSECKKSVFEFSKNLMLSSNEKLLREVGLKDEKGAWTVDAFKIVVEKEAVALGFKSSEDMAGKIGFYEGGNLHLSIFEINALFSKFKDELIEIAKQKKEEDKK